MSSGDWYLCAWQDCTFICHPGWPICPYHAIQVHTTVQTWAKDNPPARTTTQAEVDRAIERRRLERGRAKLGDIYYVRLNSLVKIGWSSQLQVRLHDYTPGAELLVHYIGTRRDETNLHRTFAYCRVTGREWYDGSSGELNRHIAEMVQQHGEPRYTIEHNAKPAQVPHKHHRQRSTRWQS